MSAPLSPDDLSGLYGDPSAPKLLGAVAASDPGSIDGNLYVTINSFGPQRWGPCPFMPRGDAWPKPGMPCLVAIDDDGLPWVIAWDELAPSKSAGDGGGGGAAETPTESPSGDANWMAGAHRHDRSAYGTKWQVTCPSKGVLHTTEGLGDATSTFDANHDWPHFQVRRDGTITQYMPMSIGSNSLKHTGSPPTNGAHAYQIEVEGHAANTSWPADQITAVRSVMRFIETNGGVERASHVTFVTDGSNRLSGSAWIALTGWCGHQHVPENDHYDPGAIDISTLL